MSQSLTGKKIMILTASGVEESELVAIQRELVKTGAVVQTVATEQGLVNCWNKISWGLYFPVDAHISTTLAADYDALVVPGGKRSITKLAGNPHSERIMSGFMAAKKPVVMMGDAVELLAAVKLADDITLGGAEDSRAVVTEAGAKWDESAVVVDGHVMSGDTAGDMEAFVAKILQHLAGQDDMKAAA